MNKNEKLVMVVERKILFGNEYFEGFRLKKEVDYESRILKNFKYMKRALVEQNPEYKQPIAYSIIVNPNLKKVFAYQRSIEDKKYSEKRLQGKWSFGIGGHIEKFDIENDNPVYSSMLRELEEEVEINGCVKPKILGYINLEDDEVSKVHFGILYLIETDSDVIKPKALEIKEGRLRTIEELERIYLSPKFVVEDWSKIAFNQLRLYLLYKENS